ncbi:MAG: hypothetical protein HY764_02590 [Candidatus Portnoybacteria bacterium]|nr:hypothetical protein [Candidatus Portnoybacteria bacterium]
MAIFQSGSTFMQPNESRDIFRVNKKIFPFVRLVLPAVPTYYGGFFTLTLVSKKVNPDKIKPEIIQKRFKNLKIKTKYYNSKIHFASFVLPNYISNYLNKKTNR